MQDLVYLPPQNCTPIFDTHAHYNDDRFDSLNDEILGNMSKFSLSGVITCGCDAESCRESLALAERYDNVYFSAGIHPENLDSGTSITQIAEFAKHKKCVAIGEIGLDYNFCDSNKQEQKDIFEKQIMVAKELNLPVIVHDRDAHGDVLEILKKHKPKGVLHCFSGSEEMAAEILKIGMYIGVGGVITFKNARKLPDVVKMLPEDKLLLETDCPYLAPEPFRGKLCYSGMIYLTAQKIAQLRCTDTETILKQNLINTKTLFGV